MPEKVSSGCLRHHPVTGQLSSLLLTILGWRRPGKIGSANTKPRDESRGVLSCPEKCSSGCLRHHPVTGQWVGRCLLPTKGQVGALHNGETPARINGGLRASRPSGQVRRTARRGRCPAVERSGTNALGVRRSVSAAAPRCKAPAGRGAVGAGDWGRGMRYRSLRQRYALPPPSQREVRGNGFPRQCAHWLGMTGERGGQGRPTLQCATGAPQ